MFRLPYRAARAVEGGLLRLVALLALAMLAVLAHASLALWR